MVTFVFTIRAERKYNMLSSSVRNKIISKLQMLKEYNNIFSVLKKLHHFEPATHRLRIGDYRLILKLDEHSKNATRIIVLDLGDRKDIYK